MMVHPKELCRVFSILAVCFVALVPSSAEIVINEIAYHPITDSSAEEYIELYNTGPDVVDLSGWQFTDGISYVIPPGTTLKKDAYLVVAKDPTALAVLFPSMPNALGPYSGQLNNGGERVRLMNESGQVVDTVEYDDALPWSNAADGDGPSLELRHPLLDNSRSENWAASDITYNASAAWLTFTATLSNVSGEFFLFLTDRDGEGWIGDGKSAHVLFDDFELEDLSNPGTNLITDGDFESGDASSWIVEGALRARFASPEDAFSGRCCLHHWAFTSGDVSSGTDLRYRPDPPLLLMTERTYQVACRYRVIHGTALLHVGAGTVVPASPVFLEKRQLWGTPGRSNSSWGSPQVPTLTDLLDVGNQMPRGASEAVVASFGDSSLLGLVELWYSTQQIAFSTSEPVSPPDEQGWQVLPMTADAGSNDGVFRASIPSQTGNTLVRYLIRWTDLDGREYLYPQNGSHPSNLLAYVPGPTPDYGVPHFFLHVNPEYYQFFLDMLRSGSFAPGVPVLDLSVYPSARRSFSATLVDCEDGCAYEDIRWRPRGFYNLHDALDEGFRVGVSIDFNSGFLYKGKKREFGLNNNWTRRGEAGIRTRLGFEAFRRAGVPASRTRYAWLTMNGHPMGLMTEQEYLDNEFLNRWGRDGNGSLYKARWRMRGTSYSEEPILWADESPLSHLEDYRDCYLKKNRRDSSHSDLISMIHDLNQPELRGRVFDMETNGSEIEFQEEVFEKQIDVDNLLTRYSVDHILINRDRGFQNHFLYQDASRDGHWETYPWDLDTTWQLVSRQLWWGLGQFNESGEFLRDPLFPETAWYWQEEPLFTRLMFIPEYRDRYIHLTRDQLRTTFSERQIFEILDRYADEGHVAFREDIARWSHLFSVLEEAVYYCMVHDIPTTEPMDCVVAWFKNHVKLARLRALYRARSETQLLGYAIPPVLSDGRTEPLVPTPDQAIGFRVNAISSLSSTRNGAANAITRYCLNGGLAQAATMTHTTVVQHDGDFSFQIAAQPEGTSIEYWFEMLDDLGLTDRFPETGSLYTEVVDDPTSAESLVTINEIMYHSDLLGNEWVEIQNASTRTVDVSRWLLGDSIAEHRFRLPVDISLAPGELLAIAANEFVVREAYGSDNVVGDFEFNFGNAGDVVLLFDSGGNPIDVVAYTDEVPWPGAADGFGPSLELLDAASDNADPTSWDTSVAQRGTPGQPNRVSTSPASVVINECSYDPTDQGVTNDYNNDGVGSSAADEFVEIYNTTDSAVDISGWNLDDDDVTNDNTFTFPEETSIPGNGFVVIFGGGVPTGFGAQVFTGLPRLGNNGDQVRLFDGHTLIDSIGFEGGAVGALANLPIRADGGVIARETDGSPLFEARAPEFATPGESNNLFLPPSADLNGDSVTNHLDLLEFLRQYRNQETQGVMGTADLNNDDHINDLDLFLFDWQWNPGSAPKTRGQ